jgi:hypothetical protein
VKEADPFENQDARIENMFDISEVSREQIEEEVGANTQRSNYETNQHLLESERQLVSSESIIE